MGKETPKLKRIYSEKGITSCELRLSGCWGDNGLSFAHFKKRIHYKSRPELLSSFYQTILCCISCHNAIEYNKVLTAKVFGQLRGERTQEEWNEPRNTTKKLQMD